MTGINDYDRADRYEDGRTRYDDADPADVHGAPGPLPIRLTPAQQDRRARTEDDPFAPHMAGGTCSGCGGRAGHATRCPHNPAARVHAVLPLADVLARAPRG